MKFIELFTRSFPFLVTACALIALLHPPSFTWFSGPVDYLWFGRHYVGYGTYVAVE